MDNDPIETPSRPSVFAPPPPVREATIASDPRYWALLAVTLLVELGGLGLIGRLPHAMPLVVEVGLGIALGLELAWARIWMLARSIIGGAIGLVCGVLMVPYDGLSAVLLLLAGAVGGAWILFLTRPEVRRRFARRRTHATTRRSPRWVVALLRSRPKEPPS